MKKQILLLSLLVLIVLAALPAQAQTITMANPGGIAERDVIVYYPNGSMQGYYNSTSVITLDGNMSYIFTMKPLGSNPIEDPNSFVQGFFLWIQTNVTALIVLAVIIGALTYRR